jgi:hypothetical protein
MMTDDENNARFDVAKIVVLSGWSLTILACLVVIMGAVYAAFQTADPLAPLKEWASMCLGFLLGAFVTLVKDFIRPPQA